MSLIYTVYVADYQPPSRFTLRTARSVLWGPRLSRLFLIDMQDARVETRATESNPVGIGPLALIAFGFSIPSGIEINNGP